LTRTDGERAELLSLTYKLGEYLAVKVVFTDQPSKSTCGPYDAPSPTTCENHFEYKGDYSLSCQKCSGDTVNEVYVRKNTGRAEQPEQAFVRDRMPWDQQDALQLEPQMSPITQDRQPPLLVSPRGRRLTAWRIVPRLSSIRIIAKKAIAVHLPGTHGSAPTDDAQRAAAGSGPEGGKRQTYSFSEDDEHTIPFLEKAVRNLARTIWFLNPDLQPESPGYSAVSEKWISKELLGQEDDDPTSGGLCDPDLLFQ
jgi:hypothetical protein